MVPITFELLRKISPTGNPTLMASIVEPLNRWCPQYGVTTPLRMAHFLAQIKHESAHFRTMHEYANGWAYEGRVKLGNNVKGDGPRFKGRGLIQITGRFNYTKYGLILGLDLVNNPELAVIPENAVRIALEYWRVNGLNALADMNDLNGITYRINGGYNGLVDRHNAFLIAQRELAGVQIQPVMAAVTIPEVTSYDNLPEAPIATPPAKPWYTDMGIIGTAMSYMSSLPYILTSWYAVAGITAVALIAAGVFFYYHRKKDPKYKELKEIE